ncbi:hypothetical protein QYM36_011551 [Artemia franciscana]|uniref:Uncharacterized protein n=1 Tax=Artemia franciscana TaxID=6661 RepID=A0AA88L1F0_ARTSF|nr:hypothetical protein QYM36_011551 [Artemia franciscana]
MPVLIGAHAKDATIAQLHEQVLIPSPSDLEVSEITMLQGTISSLKKDLSVAQAEIVIIQTDLVNAGSHNKTLENHFELNEYLISNLKKLPVTGQLSSSSATVDSQTQTSIVPLSEVSNPSQSKMNRKTVTVQIVERKPNCNDPPLAEATFSVVNTALQSAGHVAITCDCELCSNLFSDASVHKATDLMQANHAISATDATDN